jgi:protein SCO1/2
MRNPKVLLAVGIALGLTVAVAATMLRMTARPYTFHGSLIDPAVAATDFTLTDQNGQPFRLSEQKGKAALLFFGYTNCPDACPTTLTQFKKIRAQLGKDADEVQFVLITVDPERDTSDRLRDYLSGFDPTFIGLTSSVAEMETVWQAYGVYREKHPVEDATSGAGGHTHAGEDYVVDHTTRIYAIDRRGNLRLTYTIDTATEDVTQDVQQLLKGN